MVWTGRPAPRRASTGASKAALFQEWPPTKTRVKSSPSRQSSSAAWRRARWFLRGSWLPTARTMGRVPMASRSWAWRRAVSLGVSAWTGRGMQADVGAGQSGAGQHGPPAPILQLGRPGDGGDAVHVGGGRQIVGEPEGHALGGGLGGHDRNAIEADQSGRRPREPGEGLIARGLVQLGRQFGDQVGAPPWHEDAVVRRIRVIG